MSNRIASYARRYLHTLSDCDAVFFHHLSKCGGTDLCLCGWSNGCRAWGGPNKADNCHPPFDAFRWEGGVRGVSSPRTCKELAAYNRRYGYTLEGNENYIIGDGLCPQFWNIIILRDPIARLASHLAMCSNFGRPWCLHGKQGPAWLSQATPRWLFREKHIIADNFYIRSLLGEDVFHLPFGAIGWEHFVKAKQVLQRFDVVYTLSENFSQDLRLSLGWSCSPKIKRPGNSTTKVQLVRHWGTAGLSRLRNQNRFDMLLYDRARWLARMDRAVFTHPSFRAAADDNARCMDGLHCGYLCHRTRGAA